MSTLRRLLGHDDKFYSLLEASAKEAQSSVQLLNNMLQGQESALTLTDFAYTRHKDKRITEEITEELCKTFVTPLEREDIEALSFALYKIPKIAERFGEKFLFCHKHLQGVDFSRQLSILERATGTVTEMVQRLRQHKHLEQMRESHARLHALEGEADKVMLELMRDLYGGSHEPLKVIVRLDLYETLEAIIDRCRDAGNIIFRIVLKYS
jgi:hypothetical protein